MKFSPLKSMLCVATAVGVYALTAAGAYAQTAQNAPANTSPSTDENAIEEVVVTGTMLRGVAPIGSTVTGLSTEEIQATSSNNTQQILTNLPQNSSFNNLVPMLMPNWSQRTAAPAQVKSSELPVTERDLL